MQLTTLGTSAMVPTKTRNQTAILLRFRNEGMLFDCGEGTQRQFQLAGISITKITRLFITHWHGDHTQGISGLIQSLGANEYKQTLHIYGPSGTARRIQALKQAFVFELKIKFEIHEVEEGIIVDDKHFSVEAVKLNHSIACFGYKILEKDKRNINKAKLKKLKVPSGPHLKPLSDGKDSKYKSVKLKAKELTKVVKGKSVSMIWDTGLCPGAKKLAKADYLVVEATFGEDLKEKAKDFNHLTAKGAASLAKQAKAKKLLLMHFSPRYKNLKKLEEEAREVFKESVIAKDLASYTLN